MEHYHRGRLVALTEENRGSITFVHTRCLLWSPQIGCNGDKVTNFKKEVNRASKLKCSQCGIRGASLGCFYLMCKKNFHVPCAVKILDCRWDTVNFNVLCPAHRTQKLPCDNEQNDYVALLESDEHNVCNKDLVQNDEQDGWNKGQWAGLVLLACPLNASEEKNLIKDFAAFSGATVSEKWEQNVTHVVVPTNSEEHINSFEVLMAIMNGKWIVTLDWIMNSLKKGQKISEEPYELGYGLNGLLDGPRRGRIQARNPSRGLFTGMQFHLSAHLSSGNKTNLAQLILAGGGKLLDEDDAPCGMAESDGSYFVYSLDPPLDSRGIADAMRELEQAWDCAKNGAGIISHMRVFQSVAAYDAQLLNNSRA